jgi:hypothetical protein
MPLGLRIGSISGVNNSNTLIVRVVGVPLPLLTHLVM